MKRSLENELVKWKGRKDYCPLLLRGARQVGKSYLVESFGKAHFENVITIDFELRPEVKGCFETRDPQAIVEKLEFVFHEKIQEGKTLLFFDEIQECPNAFASLRYFRERLPKLHVIAAGSFMEFMLNNEKYSFPVGRVEFLYLRPLSFQEFLQNQAPFLYEKLDNVTLDAPLPTVGHEEFLKLVKQYFFIGGMPRAIQEYVTSTSLLSCQEIQVGLLQSYKGDFKKYATKAQLRNLQLMFQKVPEQVGQVVKYSKIDKDIRSQELKEAIFLLCEIGLMQQALATTASGLPLFAHIHDHRFKLFFLDVGLLQSSLHTSAQDFLEKEIIQINNGMLAEQFVSQELLAYAEPHKNEPLLFWEDPSGQAEVDFVQTVQTQIIPIEVKAGATGMLRSLHSFLKKKKLPLGVRISEKPLSLHENILSIPMYMVSHLPRLVIDALNKL